MDAFVVVSPSSVLADTSPEVISVGVSSSFSVETMLVVVVVGTSFFAWFLLTSEKTREPIRTPSARNRKIQAHFTRPDDKDSSS